MIPNLCFRLYKIIYLKSSHRQTELIMADDVPDLYDVEDYDAYEAQYADDFDMIEDEDGISVFLFFNRFCTNRTGFYLARGWWNPY